MILQQIAARKAPDIAAAQKKLPEQALMKIIESGEYNDRRGFRAALMGRSDFAIIGEIKRSSPSRGLIRADFDPAALARQYGESDVQALSVLTEVHYFGGDDAYPALIRAVCPLPILRKDFLIDRWQVYQSAVLGVDAVLLIAALLPDGDLREFLALARSLRLDALVEVHDRTELDRALSAGADLIGINNRNLHDFTVSLAVTESLAPHVPKGCVLVGESGIHTHGEAARMRDAGVHALLIGESLMRAAHIPSAVAALRGTAP